MVDDSESGAFFLLSFQVSLPQILFFCFLNYHLMNFHPLPFVPVIARQVWLFGTLDYYQLTNLNPGLYSPEERRSTEAIGSAGDLVVSKELSLNFNFTSLNRISLLLNQVATTTVAEG